MKCSNGGANPNRERSLTSMSLSWLAKKVRRANQLKESINSGAYQINHEAVAKSLITDEVDPGR